MKEKQLQRETHCGMDFFYCGDEEGHYNSVALMPSTADSSETAMFFQPFSAPPFQLAIASRAHGTCYSLINGATTLPKEMVLQDIITHDNVKQLVYFHPALGLKVTVNMEFVPGCHVVRQICEVENLSDQPHILTHFSSACMEGVGGSGILPWYHDDKMYIHYTKSFGQAENQWFCEPVRRLGLYPSSVHPSAGTAKFLSIGSRSFGQHAPMAVLENRETSEVWFFQMETSTSWFFEIGNRNASVDPRGSFFIHTTTADERYLGFTKKLNRHEKYCSMPVAYGTAKGGFEEAVRELTRYRRSRLKKSVSLAQGMPVVFNDYMNCLWAEPTAKKLIPLIDAAAENGAEVFCIDAGWYCKPGDINNSLGDWEPCEELFGQNGFSGILQYIRSRGMLPGCWLEIESCGENSRLAKMPEYWFIHRNGSRVQDNPRLYLDFTVQEVKDHMMNVISRLYSMGIRYVKNDYNGCISVGTDFDGKTSPCDGAHDYFRSIYRFWDDVTMRFPGLIIENCSSGALRQDYGILSRCHLQSTSDQEIYYKYPFIISGSLATLLPEQSGIWAYPYPLLFNEREHADILNSSEYLDTKRDGEETIFNMVNGMCGVLTLSGHPECADPVNRELIQQAVAIYKSNREFIAQSFVTYPRGTASLDHMTGYVVLGLTDDNMSKMLLYVWRNRGDDDYCTIPLPADKPVLRLRQLYPQKDGFETEFYYSANRRSLTVHYEKPVMARIFEIIFEEK